MFIFKFLFGLQCHKGHALKSSVARFIPALIAIVNIKATTKYNNITLHWNVTSKD